MLGGWLARREGAKAWASLRGAQQNPAKQGAAMTDAALVLVGAFLIILPGFLSDAVGLFFLIPATRGIARRGLTGLFGVLTRKYRDRADLLWGREPRRRRWSRVRSRTPSPSRPRTIQRSSAAKSSPEPGDAYWSLRSCSSRSARISSSSGIERRSRSMSQCVR